MKPRIWLYAFVLLAMALAPLTAVAQEPKPLKIASSMPDMAFPFFVHMQAQIRAEVEALGNIELIEMDGQDKVEKQTADVEAAIVSGVDALIISPKQVDAMAPAVQEAVDAGVVVVTIDRRIEGVDGILAHVGADNVRGGELQAEWVLANYPDGARIFHLLGTPGAGPAIDRAAGVHNVLDPVQDKYPIVFEQTANFRRDDGLKVTEAGLAGLDEPPDVIIAANDDMALGALEAVKALGLEDQIAVLGFDALPEAVGSIRDGGLAGSIEQHPGGQSRKAVEIAVAYLREGVEPESDVVLLEPVLITLDNLMEAERIGEVEPVKADKGTIVFIPKSTDVSYWLFLKAGVEKRAAELGYTTDYQGVAREVNIAEQADLVRNVAASKPAGIIMAATDAGALVPPVEEAIAAGIPLVTVDSGVDSDAPYAHILTDNIGGAAMGADILAELIGGAGKVGNLGILAGSQTGRERDQGFLDQIAKYPDIEVLPTQFTGCDPAVALNAATDIITANPDIKGFYSACGPNGLGIAQAVKAAGLAGKVVIVTFDPNPEVIPLFEEGVIQVMIAQDPFQMGVRGVDAIDAVINGKTIDPRVVYIPVTIITQENYNDPAIQAMITLPE